LYQNEKRGIMDEEPNSHWLKIKEYSMQTTLKDEKELAATIL
jgi:hypothetical protein